MSKRLLPRITEYYRVLPDGHDILESLPLFSDKNLMWGFLNGKCRFSLCEKYKMNFIAYSQSKKRWKIIKLEYNSLRLWVLNWVWGTSFWQSLCWNDQSSCLEESYWHELRNMVKICFVSKVIASLIDGPLTSAKNYGRPNSSQSEKLIRNKTILSLWALFSGLVCDFYQILSILT